MKNNYLRKALTVLACAAAGFSILFLDACTSTQTRESTGQYIDSSAITSKVKADLLTQLGTQSLAISVKSFKDEVQLSGFVNSEAMREKAGKVAANVSGVRKVSNNLIVK